MDIRLSKTVRRITVLSPEEGRWQAITIYKKKGKKKRKRSKMLRPLERGARRLAKGNRKIAQTYLKRHNKSTRKKRDGWLRDLGYNVYRANRKGAKTLKIPRWF